MHNFFFGIYPYIALAVLANLLQPIVKLSQAA